MANFDLNAYETVEQRHSRVMAEHPDLRCVIVNHTTPQDRAQGVWVVESRVYMNAGDQVADLPKATDWAFEIDGQGMANKTSALENAATSALGRALRFAFAGSKGPSREEMAKASRGITPGAVVEVADADELKMVRLKVALSGTDELNVLWASLAPIVQTALKAEFSDRKKALK